MIRYLYKQINISRVFGMRRHVNFTANLLHLDETSFEKEDCPAGFVEVYLVVPHLGRPARKGDFQGLMGRIKRLASELHRVPVFLSKDTALDYARFLDDNHGILRSFVPDSAIEGRSQELGLKKGFINHCHIHGCFITRGEQHLYLKNPEFQLPLCA